MTSSQNVVLFGATGFVGSAVKNELEVQGHHVICITAPRFCPVEADCIEEASEHIELEEDVVKAIASADAVINAAGNPDSNSRDEGELNAANALFPAVLARACRRLGVPRLVHVSSATVQGQLEPLDSTFRYQTFSPYSRSKMRGEKLVLNECGEDAVIYRPGAVHHSSRAVSQKVAKLASSPFRFVPKGAPFGSPQALLTNVAKGAVLLATIDEKPPSVIHHPWERVTTKELLRYFGGKNPIEVPASLVTATFNVFSVISKVFPQLAPHVRRVQLLWYGQSQAQSWLEEDGRLNLSTSLKEWKELGGNLQCFLRDVGSSDVDARRPKIVLGVTIEQSLQFFKDVSEFLVNSGYEVHIVASVIGSERCRTNADHIHFHALHMERSLAPLSDVKSLLAWVQFLRKIRPDVTLIGTPKAGLLGTVAARIVGVPTRIYHLRGLRLETVRGVRRLVLSAMERFTFASATGTLVTSESLRDVVKKLGLAGLTPMTLLGAGSSNGVDVERFSPAQPSCCTKGEKFAYFGLNPEFQTIGFVGRLAEDKGVSDLLRASDWLVARGVDHQLLIVGSVEDSTLRNSVDGADTCRRPVVRIDHTESIEDIYPLMDVLCLPTYREGFPNVVLEASACAVPTVTTDATGAVDSVIDGVTGRVVRLGEVPALTDALQQLLEDKQLAKRMGLAARERVVKHFSRTTVHNNLFKFLLEQIGEH